MHRAVLYKLEKRSRTSTRDFELGINKIVDLEQCTVYAQPHRVGLGQYKARDVTIAKSDAVRSNCTKIEYDAKGCSADCANVITWTENSY